MSEEADDKFIKAAKHWVTQEGLDDFHAQAIIRMTELSINGKDYMRKPALSAVLTEISRVNAIKESHKPKDRDGASKRQGEALAHIKPTFDR